MQEMVGDCVAEPTKISTVMHTNARATVMISSISKGHTVSLRVKADAYGKTPHITARPFRCCLRPRLHPTKLLRKTFDLIA